MRLFLQYSMIFVLIFIAILGLLHLVYPLGTFRGYASQSACVNNLRQIEGAKSQCAIRDGKAMGDFVSDADVEALLGGELTCHAGGNYTYGIIGETATCSMNGKLVQGTPWWQRLFTFDKTKIQKEHVHVSELTGY